MSQNKTRGIVIKGSKNCFAYGNKITGCDEGIVIEDSTDSSAFQNIVVSKETVNITDQIQMFIDTLNENFHKLNLTQEQTQEVQSDINTIEAQLKSPQPKASIISPCFESIKNILENAAGGAIGAALVTYTDKVLAFLSS